VTQSQPCRSAHQSSSKSDAQRGEGKEIFILEVMRIMRDGRRSLIYSFGRSQGSDPGIPKRNFTHLSVSPEVAYRRLARVANLSTYCVNLTGDAGVSRGG